MASIRSPFVKLYPDLIAGSPRLAGLGPYQFGIYMRLFCAANPRGELRAGPRALFEDELQTVCRTSTRAALLRGLERLERDGLLDRLEDGTWRVTNFHASQKRREQPERNNGKEPEVRPCEKPWRRR